MQPPQSIEITNPSRRRLSKAAADQYKGITGRWPVHGSRVPTRDQPREACRGRRIVAAGAPELQGRRPSSAYHGREGARLVTRRDVSVRRRPWQRGAVCNACPLSAPVSQPIGAKALRAGLAAVQPGEARHAARRIRPASVAASCTRKRGKPSLLSSCAARLLPNTGCRLLLPLGISKTLS